MGITAQLLAYTGKQFMSDLGNLTVLIVGIAGAFMTLYAIYIAFLFATASDPGKRKAARERLLKVAASAFIIIGLAAMLGVINVTFNKVEGNVSGTNSGSNGTYTTGYTYNLAVQMKVTNVGNKYLSGGFKLYSKNIKSAGKDIDAEGSEVKFTKCDITNPKGVVTNTAKNSFNTGTVGECSYVFESKDLKLPCTKLNGEYVWVMQVYFTTKSDTSKTYSMFINVYLDLDGVDPVQY